MELRKKPIYKFCLNYVLPGYSHILFQEAYKKGV